MKTHLTRIALAWLCAAALALPTVAQDGQAPTTEEMARLKQRITMLEDRVDALEGEADRLRPGGEAIERVALLAHRAMRNLIQMVQELKLDLEGKGL